MAQLSIVGYIGKYCPSLSHLIFQLGNARGFKRDYGSVNFGWNSSDASVPRKRQVSGPAHVLNQFQRLGARGENLGLVWRQRHRLAAQPLSLNPVTWIVVGLS